MANTSPETTKDTPDTQKAKSVAMRFFGQTAGMLMAVGSAISIFHNPLHKDAEKLNAGQRIDNIVYNIGLTAVGSVIAGLVVAAFSYFRGNKKEQQPASTQFTQSSLNQTAPEAFSIAEPEQQTTRDFSHTAAEKTRRETRSQEASSLAP